MNHTPAGRFAGGMTGSRAVKPGSGTSIDSVANLLGLETKDLVQLASNGLSVDFGDPLNDPTRVHKNSYFARAVELVAKAIGGSLNAVDVYSFSQWYNKWVKLKRELQEADQYDERSRHMLVSFDVLSREFDPSLIPSEFRLTSKSPLSSFILTSV